MVDPVGVEPTTYPLEGGCSIQLSYESIKWLEIKLEQKLNILGPLCQVKDSNWMLSSLD